MKNLFRTKATLIIIVVIVVLSVLIGVINASKIKVTFIENSINAIITPVQKLITGGKKNIDNFFGYFSDIDAIRSENEKLKKENAKLEGQLKTAQKAEKENETLRNMLGLKKNMTEMNLVSAQIISRDPANWFSTVTIDKGAADGVLVDQAVISSNKALVGRVFEVGSNWSKVITIMDPECSVGALIERSGEYGVTEGDAKLESEGKCKLSYISKISDVLVGDTLVTAGLGGIFPKGISIGNIQSVQTDVQGISQYAIIVPTCDFDKLEYVFIVKD